MVDAGRLAASVYISTPSETLVVQQKQVEAISQTVTIGKEGVVHCAQSGALVTNGLLNEVECVLVHSKLLCTAIQISTPTQYKEWKSHMLGLRDINLRNDSDSSVFGILHNLPSLFLSVVPVTFIVAGGELRKAGKCSVNRNTSFYSRTLGTYITRVQRAAWSSSFGISNVQHNGLSKPKVNEVAYIWYWYRYTLSSYMDTLCDRLFQFNNPTNYGTRLYLH